MGHIKTVLAKRKSETRNAVYLKSTKKLNFEERNKFNDPTRLSLID